MRSDKDLNYSLMTNAEEEIDLEKYSGSQEKHSNLVILLIGGGGAVGGNEP